MCALKARSCSLLQPVSAVGVYRNSAEEEGVVSSGLGNYLVHSNSPTLPCCVGTTASRATGRKHMLILYRYAYVWLSMALAKWASLAIDAAEYPSSAPMKP